MRVFTMLGFPPAIWFAGDSISYVTSALNHSPGISRESGYSLMLWLFGRLHSFAVVTGVQHLMGLAIGLMTYALLRRRGLPRWGATLAALPALLDSYVIQLEQEILPDTTFAFLVACAVFLYCWWRDEERPVWAVAAAAAALGLAAVCWPTGLPLLILLLAILVLRKAGWRAFTAAVLAGAVPLALYLGWYDAKHHKIAFNSASGVYLWSRTTTFADCAVIKPPADERPLCPRTPVGHREAASLWIWQKHSLLIKLPTGKFSPQTNALAGNFARRAILAQPLGYAKAVLDGFFMSFSWNRPYHPTKLMSERYQFSLATHDWDHGRRAVEIVEVQRAYTGGHLAATRAVRPFSTIMINYQRIMYLRGTMVGILLLLGLAAIVRAWRNGGYRRRRGWGGPALLPALAGLGILLVPVATADFSVRYVALSIPVLAIAAALLFARPEPAPTASRVSPWPGHQANLPDPDQATTGPLPAQA